MPDNKPGYRTDVNTEMMRGWMENGWSPEEAAMIARLAASGLHIPLAAVAARQIMGLGDKTPPDQRAWEAYEQSSPIMANSKKLLNKGAAPLRDMASAMARPALGVAQAQSDNEKLSAHKMLKDYLMHQDQLRAGEVQKQGLWMLARMPGAPLAGQPVYGGATGPIGSPYNDLEIGPAQVQPQYNDLAIGPAQIMDPRQARR